VEHLEIPCDSYCGRPAYAYASAHGIFWLIYRKLTDLHPEYCCFRENIANLQEFYHLFPENRRFSAKFFVLLCPRNSSAPFDMGYFGLCSQLSESKLLVKR
jgi:hypothetical protein